MEICCESGSVLREGLIGFGAIGEVEGIPDLLVEPFGVLEDTCEAGHVSATDIDDVLDAIVASVDGSHTGEGTGVEAILDSLGAVGHGLAAIAHGGGVADGGTCLPATVSALEVGETAGLIGGPLVDAHGHLAGAAVAAEAGKDFLAGVHISVTIKLYLGIGGQGVLWEKSVWVFAGLLS